MHLIKPNLIDRFIGYINPASFNRRMIERQRSTMFRYDGARSSRARRNAPGMQSSESSSNQSDRVGLMKQAQDLANNNGFLLSILRKTASYTLGKMRYQSLTGDSAIDSIYEEYWENWCRVCDITGRHNFLQIMRLTMMSMKRDGDLGLIFVRGDKRPPYLQSIEADRIGGRDNTTVTDNYFGGVTIEDSGRPISYRVYDRSPNGVYSNPREVAARNFIHPFDPLRLDQYRGITAFHACIEDLRDIQEILDFEKMAVKWGSSRAGVITTELGEADEGVNFDESTTDLNGNTLSLEEIQGGALIRLAAGEKAEMFDNSRPSQAFTGFLPLLLRKVAVSINLPYGFLFDLAGINGPAVRMESSQAHRAFEWDQSILVDKAAESIKNVILAYGIAEEGLPIHKNWMRGKWQFGAHTTIDVGRESKANLDEHRQGLGTASKIYSESGEDWEEQYEQKAKEARKVLDLSEKYKVPPSMIQMMTPNGNELMDPNEAKKQESEN